MTLTDNGLVPEPSHTNEQLGAWLRVLPIAQRMTAKLASFVLSDSDNIDDCWVWPTGSTNSRKVCPDDGARSLNEPNGEPGDSVLFVRGPRAAVNELLAAIARENASTAQF